MNYDVKFTKAPWKSIPDAETRRPDLINMVVGPSEVVCGDDGICCPDRYNDRSFIEDKANMQLISCSPEMFYILIRTVEDLMCWVDETKDSGYSVGYTESLIREAEELLEKAVTIEE